MQTPEQKEHRLARTHIRRDARAKEAQDTVAKMQKAIFKSKNVRNTRAQSAEAGKMQRTLLAANTGARSRPQALAWAGEELG